MKRDGVVSMQLSTMSVTIITRGNVVENYNTFTPLDFYYLLYLNKNR